MENPAKPPNGNNGNELPLPKKVGIVHSEVKREYFPTESQYITEKDAIKDAKLVGDYLEKLGVSAILYEGNAHLPEKIFKDNPQMIINLVGSVKGSEYLASAIPAMLEAIDIPYTGAGILGESLSYNKFLTKKLIQQIGVPVPYYQLFTTPNDLLDPTLRFPLISKLNEIHGGVEITRESVSETEKHLRERLKFLIETYQQPVLVEEFIAGREITAILLEGGNKKVYLAEKVFEGDEKYSFVTFESQWGENKKDDFSYQKYDDPLLKDYVRKTFDITKMADYAKFDVRLDLSGRYFFIDCNSNPAFGPRETGTAISTIMELYGITFLEVLKRVMLNTMQAYKG